MRIDILTLFPETMERMTNEAILGRAQDRGYLLIKCHNIRDYTKNKQMQVDDYPYGGGMGMVMQADPLYNCLSAVRAMAPGEVYTVYMSPQGKPFTQETAKRLSGLGRLVIVCGHYEGVDERFIEECVDEEIALGDFVLTGGEIPALAVCDAVARLTPGVLASEESFTGESHWDGTLEYPQYSRPEEWHGRSVPPVLLSGDHAKVADWRRGQSLLRTKRKRPDMFARLTLNAKDLKLLERAERESNGTSTKSDTE